MSIQILAARFQEKQDEIDHLRTALAKAEAERISERTARIAKVEELGRYITDYESAIRAVTLAIDQRDAAIARAEKAEADLLKVAHTIGIVHEPDAGPCWPGPIEEIVKAINDAKYEAREADAERARADRYLAAMAEMIDAESQAHNATAPVPPAVSRYLAALESIRALVAEARK